MTPGARARSRPLSLGSSSARLGVLSIVGLASGLLRESAIAYRFGAGPSYDAFLLASVPFDLLSVIAAIQMSAVQRAVSEREAAGAPGAGYELWVAVTRVLAVSFLAIGLVCALAAPLILPRLAGTLGAADLPTVAWLLVLLIPAPAAAAWLAMQSAALNARHWFAGLPLTGIAVNVAMAAATLGLGRALGSPALVVGTLGGLGAGIVLQQILFRRAGFQRATPRPKAEAHVRWFFAASWPLIVLALLGRFYIVIERFLAAGLPAGTISGLAFANRFATVPIAVVSSVATPFFTMLVAHSVQGDRAAFVAAGERGIRLSLFVVAPAIVFLALFAEPVVRALLQRGNFGAADVAFTAEAVRAFSWGIFGWVGADLTTRMLWASSQYWKSLQLAAAFVVINIVGAVSLREVGGGLGLAMARSIAFLSYFVLAVAVVRREHREFAGGRLLGRLVGQIAVACGCAAAVRFVFDLSGAGHLPLIGMLIALTGAAVATAGLYILIERTVRRSEEGIWATGFVRTRIAAVLGRA